MKICFITFFLIISFLIYSNANKNLLKLKENKIECFKKCLIKKKNLKTKYRKEIKNFKKIITLADGEKDYDSSKKLCKIYSKSEVSDEYKFCMANENFCGKVGFNNEKECEEAKKKFKFILSFNFCRQTNQLQNDFNICMAREGYCEEYGFKTSKDCEKAKNDYSKLVQTRFCQRVSHSEKEFQDCMKKNGY
jgi:hypothetical protein